MPWYPKLINAEILSVHAAIVPVGSKATVLMFGGDEHNPAQSGTDTMPADPANVDRTALYDVASMTVTRTTSPTTDVFGAGHAFMGDGRLLVVGGTESWGGPESYTPDINWNTRTYFDFVSLEEHCHAIASSGFHRSDSLR
jgi:hypothetical protein